MADESTNKFMLDGHKDMIFMFLLLCASGQTVTNKIGELEKKNYKQNTRLSFHA